MNDVQRIDLNDYVQTGEGGTAKIPYMVDMVNHGRLPDEAYDSLIEFFGIK